MKTLKFFFLIIVINLFRVYGLNLNDTVIFSSEKVGLYVYTHNIDSIKFFPERLTPPNPFGPSMSSFSTRINAYDTSDAVVIIKDALKNTLITFIWRIITPGAYRFDWWEYVTDLPSGVYHVEKFIGNTFDTYRAIIVK